MTFTIISALIQITVTLAPWFISVVRNTRFKWAVLPACIMMAFTWEMNIPLGLLMWCALVYFAWTIPSKWSLPWRKKKNVWSRLQTGR